MKPFLIDKIISRGKGERMQITTTHAGHSVTRHIINFRGAHPNPEVPKWHRELETELARLQEEGRQLHASILKTSKSKSYLSDVIREIDLSILQGQEMACLLSTRLVTSALEDVRRDYPLSVEYRLAPTKSVEMEAAS